MLQEVARSSFARVGWRTVVVAASGPSMDGLQAEAIAEAQREDRVRVIVVNDTWRLLPDADVLFASDLGWWRNHAAAVQTAFNGERWTTDRPSSKRYGVHFISVVRGDGLSKVPGEIINGGNTGYNAIGLAHQFGARRILLVGFDMQKGPNGEKHWFGEHAETGPDGRRTGLSASFPVGAWLRRFARLSADLQLAGVECVNCTRETALTDFARGDLRQNLWRP